MVSHENFLQSSKDVHVKADLQLPESPEPVGLSLVQVKLQSSLATTSNVPESEGKSAQDTKGRRRVLPSYMRKDGAEEVAASGEATSPTDSDSEETTGLPKPLVQSGCRGR
jgi:hypothetical protein